MYVFPGVAPEVVYCGGVKARPGAKPMVVVSVTTAVRVGSVCEVAVTRSVSTVPLRMPAGTCKVTVTGAV